MMTKAKILDHIKGQMDVNAQLVNSGRHDPAIVMVAYERFAVLRALGTMVEALPDAPPPAPEAPPAKVE